VGKQLFLKGRSIKILEDLDKNLYPLKNKEYYAILCRLSILKDYLEIN